MNRKRQNKPNVILYNQNHRHCQARNQLYQMLRKYLRHRAGTIRTKTEQMKSENKPQPNNDSSKTNILILYNIIKEYG